MASRAVPAPSTGGGTWSIGRDDHGTISEIQDLGEQYGLNLARDKTVKNNGGRHVAVEFGFGSLYASVDPKLNIVDPPSGERGDTIKFSSGAFNYTGTVQQIAIHRAGAHARIIVPKKSVKPS